MELGRGKLFISSNLNGTGKVESNVQVAKNKNPKTPCRNCFLRGGWGGQCPQLKFFKTFGTVQNDST